MVPYTVTMSENKALVQRKSTTTKGGKPLIKRLLANKCERERVRKINEAFEVLKKHIPYCDSGRIRTKLDVLRFAIDYIQILSKMVSQNKAAELLNAASTMSQDEQQMHAGYHENDMLPVHSMSAFLPEETNDLQFGFMEAEQMYAGLNNPSPNYLSPGGSDGTTPLSVEENRNEGEILGDLGVWENNNDELSQLGQHNQQWKFPWSESVSPQAELKADSEQKSEWVILDL